MSRFYHSLLVALIAVLLLAAPTSTAAIPGFIGRDRILPVRTERNQSLGSSVVFGDVVLTARHIVTVWAGPLYLYDRSRNLLLGTTVLCDGAAEIDFAVLDASIIPFDTKGQRQLPSKGERVWIAGYPGGLWTVRTATVLRVEENVVVGTLEGTMILRRVVGVSDPTRATSYPGISGGGVFNEQGELLGIVCCIQEGTGWVGFVPLEDGLSECSDRP